MVGGLNQVYPPAEFAGFFGPPPNFTFVDLDAQAFFDAVWKFPKTGDPEESIRVWKKAHDDPFSVMENAINYLVNLIDEDGEIDGVLGYSEGAWTAASVIAEEQYRQRHHGREPRIKFGVFIGGFPPTERELGIVTESDVGQIIDIPTIHVMGTADPYIEAGQALYDVCNPEKAEMFGHAGGHVIPRDLSTLDELADVMKETISEIEST